MKTSARNQLAGTVAAVRPGAVNDEVELALPGGARIVAIITHESTRSLGLAQGSAAFALVKASSVMLATELGGAKLSARNQLAGTVSALHPGAVNAEVVLALGCIPLAEYGTPGTSELSDEIRPFIKNFDALLMSNHGVVTYGANIEEAFNRMDTVEHFAKISIYTKILGKERLLSSQDVEKLWVQRQKYYGLEGSDAKAKDPMCPITDGVSETISLTRGELIDLIERVVSNLK